MRKDESEFFIGRGKDVVDRIVGSIEYLDVVMRSNAF
jgi:hypothetical protein